PAQIVANQDPTSTLTSGRCLTLGRTAFAQFPQKLIRRDKERVLLNDASDENHRVSSHDVDDQVAATLRQIIKTDYGILILRNDVVEPALVFEEILNPGPVARSPFGVSHHAGEREAVA